MTDERPTLVTNLGSSSGDDSSTAGSCTVFRYSRLQEKRSTDLEDCCQGPDRSQQIERALTAVTTGFGDLFSIALKSAISSARSLDRALSTAHRIPVALEFRLPLLLPKCSD